MAAGSSAAGNHPLVPDNNQAEGRRAVARDSNLAEGKRVAERVSNLAVEKRVTGLGRIPLGRDKRETERGTSLVGAK